MNEVDKVKHNDVAFVKGRGFEEALDRSDLIMPRAKLIQALSPEAVAGTAKVGTVINNLTQEVMPEVFVPILKYTEYRKFNPRNPKDSNFNREFEPGALIWTTKDPNDARVVETEFGPNGEKPTATKFLNFLCLFEGQHAPIVVSFCNTSLKVGKKLFSLCSYKAMATKCDMFRYRYRLTARQEKNDIGSYYVYNIANGDKTPDDDFAICEQIYNNLRPKIKDINVSEPHGEDVNWEK